LLVSILLTFGYLSSNNEITAIRCSGFALYRLLTPLLVIGVVMSLSLVLLENHIVPWSHFISRKTIIDIGTSKPASYLEAGRFIKEFKDYIIFISEIKNNQLKHIRIYQPNQKNNTTRTIIARRGLFLPSPAKEKKLILKLMHGWSEEQDNQNPEKLYSLNFDTYYLTLNPVRHLEGKQIEKKIKDMNIKELKMEMEELKKKKITPIPLIAEIQRKFSFSFSVLAFIIIGFPLGIITKREEKSIGFGIAIFIILFYYILMAAGKGLVISKNANPYFWMWFPDVIIVATGIVLTYLSVER